MFRLDKKSDSDLISTCYDLLFLKAFIGFRADTKNTPASCQENNSHIDLGDSVLLPKENDHLVSTNGHIASGDWLTHTLSLQGAITRIPAALSSLNMVINIRVTFCHLPLHP